MMSSSKFKIIRLNSLKKKISNTKTTTYITAIYILVNLKEDAKEDL